MEKVDPSTSTTALVVDPDGKVGTNTNFITTGGDVDWQVVGNDMYSIPTGNVGIGTVTPSQKVEVVGNIRMPSAGTGIIGANNFELWSEYSNRGRITLNSATASDASIQISLKTSGNTRMAVTKGGNVGIGTILPGEKLEVYENGADSIIKIHEDAGTHKAQLWLRSGGADYKLYSDGSKFHIDAESLVQAFTIITDGKVGIATPAPDEKLHVTGSIKMVDGNEGVGKVLTSDANGVGAWATPTGTGGAMFAISGNETSFNQE